MHSDKGAQKSITAGVVHTLIKLLKSRAADQVGLEVVLATLGTLACVYYSLNYLLEMLLNIVERRVGSIS